MSLRFIGLSGSLRQASYSTAVLCTLSEAMPADTQLTLQPLCEIPLFNDDEDGVGVAEAVASLRAAITASDGLIVISPEYNHGMTGVLKNALDWLSRPSVSSCLLEKPVLTMSVSPSPLGGVRAQQQLNETFIATRSRLVIRRQIVIGSVSEKVMDGRLVDQPTLDFILEGVRDLQNVCAR